MPVRRSFAIALLLASASVAPSFVRADEASDRKAALDRKKEAARKRAEERAAKAAAAKAAADAAAKGGGGAGGSASTSAAGAGGKASTGGAGGVAGAGGTGGKGGTGGTAGKGGTGGAAGATAKAEEKDAPLPAADIETLRKDRPERRKTTVERLRKRWGSLLAEDKGRADLKDHARRVAFLQRVRVVAEGKKDKKAIEAVDELLTKEDERHAKAMNALREGALPGGARP